MSGVIDTNLLLYAANKACREHGRAANFLAQAGRSAGKWYLTEGIVYEFFRVSTHPRVFDRPLSPEQALAFMRPFWEAESFAFLSLQEDHWELLEKEILALGHASGNLYFDIRTVVLMREHGIRTVYTADADFLQFKDIDVKNPITEED